MEIIHIVLGKANPDRLNGVNKVVFHLATEQAKAGKNVEVWGITADPKHDYPTRNFKTKLFKSSKFPFWIAPNLKSAIIDNKNAIYHLHGGWIPAFSTLAQIFSAHEITFVMTPHGAYNEVAMNRSFWTKKMYFQFFEKRLIANAFKIHCIGQSEVIGLQKLTPQSKSLLLPYGFDYNQKSNNNLKNKEFTIGFVGRLDVNTKGLDLLFEAFHIFQMGHHDTHLWIIGDGDGTAFLHEFIKTKNLKNVILFGKKFGEDKDELISQMHVFAHPSRNEGLPTSVLEAAAAGVASVVTRATNVAEYVAKFNAGIAISNNNVTELVDAFNTLYSQFQLDQLSGYSRGAQKMLDQIFSWPILVEKYDELYR